MHVLQLGPFPPPEGGVSRNMLAIRDELRARGDRCSIIATTKCLREVSEPDLHFPRSAAALAKLLKTIPFDVLHYHVGGDVSSKVFGIMAACALLGRGKSVLTLHSGGYALENAAGATKLSRDAFVFRSFERVIGVNPVMMEMFAKFGVAPDKARLIYPFALRRPAPSVKLPAKLAAFAEKHSPFLLSVSMLEDNYDNLMQIDALQHVLETHPNAGLMIVGSGSQKTKIKAAVAMKPYNQRILLADDVEHKYTLHLIDRADVLLRTTRSDGDAISVREGLFLGTPVVATDNGMRPEGCELIPVGDKAALAAAIQKVLARPKTESEIRVDDRSNIAAVLEVYDELASKKP